MESPKDQPKMAMMYGDLVGSSMVALTFLLVIQPAFQELEEGDPRLPGAYVVYLCYVWDAFFGFASWWKGNLHLSLLAGIGYIAMVTSLTVFQFPPRDDMAIIPEFLWLLLVFSCNVGLSFAYKVLLGLGSLAVVLSAALYTPALTQFKQEEVVRWLFGSTTVYLAFHCFYAVVDKEVIAMQGARLGLAFYFASKLSSELQRIRDDPEYALEGGFGIVKATCLAAIGLVALGAFRSEVSARKSLKVQVERQEDKLRMVGLALEASETAVAVATASRDIIWVNPAFERLCATKGEDLHQRPLVDVLRLSDSNSDKLLKAFDTESRKEDEIIVGDNIIQVDVSPFRPNRKDESGSASNCSNEIRFVVVFKDITEHRARERAEKAAKEEALLTKAMSESMETLTHELRTPLQGIRGICSILVQEESLPSDTKESLNLIMASSGLLLVLINNLLDIRKCNANMMDEFPLVPISSAGPINDAADFCQPVAAISNIRLCLENTNENAVIRSDSLRLQQVLINLISNAIKYTSGGSIVRISSSIKTFGEVKEIMATSLAAGERQHDGEKAEDNETKVLMISVADSGAGIAPGQAKKLFRKFAMLNSKQESSLGQNTVGQPTGTGLGLNLCLKFIHLMKGNIWATNNSGGGSTFSFYLPLVSDVSEVTRLTQKQRPPQLSAPSEPVTSFSEHRVLLVDDTLINRKVLARMLQRIGVPNAKAVDSGSAALDALERDEYDLVISDIQMPGMSGMELSEAIRKSDSLLRRPVVVGLTADTSPRVEEQCVASGMADVIHKPITVDEMRLYFATVVSRLLQPGGAVRMLSEIEKSDSSI